MINTVTSAESLGEAPERPAGRQRPKDRDAHGASSGRDHEEGREEGEEEHRFHAAPDEHRLVVDNDDGHGGLTYRWVDRKTGAVVSELTRDDLAKMRNDPGYHTGAWLDTKA